MRNALLAIAAVLASVPAAAQNVGDRIFVTERNGVQTGGRLVHFSADGLTLQVDGRERVIPSTGVGRIEKRDSLWNGMLIGALPAALMGVTGAGVICSFHSHCAHDMFAMGLVYGAMGAGIGAAIDSSIHGYSVVAGPSLSSPNARRTPSPVTTLDELWLRVRQGDTVRVVTSGGRSVSGKFVQASRASVTVRVGAALREIPSSDVLRITRAGNRHRSGALWAGAMVGTTSAVASMACSGGASTCGNPLLVGMAVGGSGALWGTMIGALIPKHPVIYGTETSAGLRVVPVLRSGHLAVAVSASF
jgi:hypothetical protein